MYVVHGGQWTSELFKFDPSSNAWSSLADGNRDKYRASAVWDPTNQEMYVYAGLMDAGDVNTFYDELFMYKPSSDSWTAKASSGSARAAHAAQWDFLSSFMITFGGYGSSGRLNDIMVWTRSSNSWSTRTVSGSSPTAVAWPASAYDQANTMLYVHGGQDSSNQPSDQLLSFAVSSNTWTSLSATNAISSRYYHTANFIGSNKIVVMGGHRWPVGTQYAVEDVQQYDISSNAWTDVTPSSNDPGSQQQHCAVFDSAGSCIFTWAGSAGLTMWRLDVFDLAAASDTVTAQMSWSEISVSGTAPTGQHFPSCAWNDQDSVMYVVHGGQWTSELFKFDPSSNAWSSLADGNRDKYRASAVWDPTNQEMYVYAGLMDAGDVNTFYDELFMYKPSSDSWTAKASSGSARAAHAAQWDFLSSFMITFGGYGSSGRLNDIMVWTRSSNSWSTRTVSGSSPTAVAWPASAYDQANTMLYVHGGQDSSNQPSDQLLSFAVSSNTWTSLSATNAISSRYYHTANFIGSNKIVVMGGHRWPVGTQYAVEDVQQYDISSNAWTDVTPSSNDPGSQQQHCAVFDSAGNRIFTWAGSAGLKLWKLDLGTSSAAEPTVTITTSSSATSTSTSSATVTITTSSSATSTSTSSAPSRSQPAAVQRRHPRPAPPQRHRAPGAAPARPPPP